MRFHPYGYTAFICDIDRFLPDGENDLRIKVDAMGQPAPRRYTGAGIYREVELLTLEKTTSSRGALLYSDNKCWAYHGKILAAILPESDSVVITATTGNMSVNVR